MKRYLTRAGGTYLVDEENKLVRMETRGPKNTSTRLTGEWQKYETVGTLGGGLLINFGHETVNGQAVARCVNTSPVIKVEDYSPEMMS